MILFDRSNCISICLKNTSPYVKLAVEDLRRDFAAASAFGCMPAYVEEVCEGCIVIEENTGNNADPVSDESFSIRMENGVIYLKAPTYLGTMWAIYTFSDRVLGVDPCYLFSDLPTERRTVLELDALHIEEKSPDFRFRGVFINDEDLLTSWKDGGGMRKMDYEFYTFTVPAHVMDMVVETMLRLKINLLIPASFLNIDNPPEKALADSVARRGIYLSQHHLEPLGLSHFTMKNYCEKFQKAGDYSFFKYPDLLKEAWTYYASKWAEYENVVWQLGLRGKADRPVWEEAKPPREELVDYGKKISEAIAVQKQIVLEATGGKAKYFTSTLWMEGTMLMKEGLLDIGEDIISVFSDAGVNQMYGPDFFDIQRDRARKYGIYYHIAYYGSGPHLAPQTGLDKLCYNIGLAHTAGDRAYMILNSSNVREFTFELGAYAQMLWNTDGFTKAQYLVDYCKKFGSFRNEMQALIQKYFDALPEATDPICYDYMSHYFTYARKTYPEKVKNFVVKDGMLLTFAGRFHAMGFRKKPGQSTEQKLCDEFYRVLQPTIPAFREICDGLAQIAEEAEEELARCIRSGWLCYANTLRYTYEWYANLAEARTHYQNNGGVSVREKLVAACECLENLMEYRKSTEYGKYHNWYRGDVKMAVARELEMTRELLGYSGTHR